MRETLSPPLRLKNESFFHGLDPHLRDEVRLRCSSLAIGPRQPIYAPGDEADAVYWVDEGRIKVSQISGGGRELTLRYLRNGGMFGEECVEVGTLRRNHAESMDNSLILQMSAGEFQELMAGVPGFAVAVTKYSLRRVREMESMFSESIFRPVRGRIAAGLLRLYHQGDPGEKTIRVTHQEVANLVGSTRETTTSVLHAFREAGVLEIANRRVTVLDPEALRRFAQQT